MPLFRGTFFRKSAELWVSFSEICAEVFVSFEEKCRIMGTILDRSYKREPGAHKLDIHPEMNSLEVAPESYCQILIYSPHYLNPKYRFDSLSSVKSRKIAPGAHFKSY